MHFLPRLASLVLPSILLAARAETYTVSIDGSASDWQLMTPANSNVGHISRNETSQGEYVWLDLAGDERTVFASPDRRVDITRFALTGDASYLYIFAQFTDVDISQGDGATQLQVAIDIDRVPSSGETFLAGFADTQVSADAAWEFLVLTRFGSGSATPGVLVAPSFTDVATPGAALTVLTTGSNAFSETRIPWSDLGFFAWPTEPLRFTVATFRATLSDDTWDADVGGPVSDALDAVTNYGDPGSNANTFSEVSDGVVDYHFDVWFHLDPQIEPSAPVLVNEFYYDTPGTESDEEWIEIYNAGAALPIDSWLLGNEETIGMAEGMAFFPAGATLEPSQAAVVALRATGFFGFTGLLPDYEFASTDVSVPDMVPATTWAEGTVGLSNSGDEVLLLDRHFTILDVATYEAGVYPGVVPHPGTVDQSLERNYDFDRDDCSIDFTAWPNPTPKVLRASLTSIPFIAGESRLRIEPTVPNPMTAATSIRFVLTRPSYSTLLIVDVQGRLVRRLLEAQLAVGPHEVVWDGRGEGGQDAAGGVYFVRLESVGMTAARTLTVVR